jgi:hypothetical protein
MSQQSIWQAPPYRLRLSAGRAEHAPPTVSRPPTGIAGRGNMSYDGSRAAALHHLMPPHSSRPKTTGSSRVKPWNLPVSRASRLPGSDVGLVQARHVTG